MKNEISGQGYNKQEFVDGNFVNKPFDQGSSRPNTESYEDTQEAVKQEDTGPGGTFWVIVVVVSIVYTDSCNVIVPMQSHNQTRYHL